MSIKIIANVIALGGAILMVLIGLIKKKEHVLLAQIGQFVMLGAANILLGGFTGAVADAVCIARNLYTFKFKYTWPVKIIFMSIQIGLTAAINESGLLGWLPVMSTVTFTLFMDVKSDRGMKLLVLITCIPWVIYDFTIMNYSAFAFDGFSIASNIVGLILITRDLKKENANELKQSDKASEDC